MPELYLYDHPVSPYSQKARIALREKEIPFKFGTPQGIGSGNGPSSFAEDNHRLEVPTLVTEDGVKIFDSTVILEYIEDQYPQNPLRAEDPLSRAKARMIEDVCDSQYEAINWGLGEITTFKRAEGEFAEQLKAKARSQIDQIHAWLTQQLDDKDWFAGESFGYADVCVWPYVNRSRRYWDIPASGTPLRNWYDRAIQRPSIRSVLEEYEANVGNMSAAYEYLQKGLFKREYRDHRVEWMIKSGGIDIVRDGLEKNNIRFHWPL
jgi:glutathione S-transferase